MPEQKKWYITNIPDGGKYILHLTEENIADMYISYGDGQGQLQRGYFCEEIPKKELIIETEDIELGSCSFCGGPLVAGAEKISYKGKVISNHNPSWGACWDCGAI